METEIKIKIINSFKTLLDSLTQMEEKLRDLQNVLKEELLANNDSIDIQMLDLLMGQSVSIRGGILTTYQYLQERKLV